MVASVLIEANVATVDWNCPDPRGPDTPPAKLAQNGYVEMNGGCWVGQVPLHVGAACGVMPILVEAGTTSLVNAVGRPESPLTGITPDGTTPKCAGSLPCVTSIGASTLKIKCELAEFGDGRKNTLIPMLS